MTKNTTKKPEIAKLTIVQLQKIETDLRIFLDDPKNPSRSSNQQFSVHDKGGSFIGDIIADGPYFTKGELEAKIKTLS
ncbi:MAG: hypothetical protein WAV73_04500 [Candidatus Moraniibacteriota bacterium]